MTNMSDRQVLLDNEWLAVRYSGELPEIAYHSAIHYLTRDADGPRLRLSERENVLLLEAASRRYEDIILRDICPENRGKTFYRGLRRAVANWRRYMSFHRRHDLELGPFRRMAAEALLKFLQTEVANGVIPSPSLNCPFCDCMDFARDLGLTGNSIPEDLRRFFAE